MNQNEADLPDIEDSRPLPSGIGPLVELLKVLLKMRSEEHNVAPKLIANVSDLEQIAAFKDADVKALSGWRNEIFGHDALALKNGELAISARGRQLKVTRIQIESLPS